MKVLDIFSGLGGFSLGLERAGMHTVAFCETNEFCREVLNKHWPRVPIYGDVRELTATQLRKDGIEPTQIDLICGGFPCQDISLAGKGDGIDGSRSGLWAEFARLIREVRPMYALIENVPALFVRGFDRVLRDLWQIGYDVEWHVIPAASVNAPHARDRIWIVAYADAGQRQQSQQEVRAGRHVASSEGQTMADTAQHGRQRSGTARRRRPGPENGGQTVANASGERRDGRAAQTRRETRPESRPASRRDEPDVADADSQRQQQQKGTEQEIRRRLGHGSTTLADTDRARLEGRQRANGSNGASERPVRSSGASIRRGGRFGERGPRLLEPYLRRVLVGLSQGLDEAGLDAWSAGEWEGVDYVAPKVPNRTNRIKALGNAVVPAIPQMIGLAIMDLEKRRI